jgi:hypothetical protein
MDLHQKFQHLAKQKRILTNKLLALLPEIYESGIYKKYTRTIHGYAMQFAQIPESVVNKTLNLESKLQNKPLLKESISEFGIHKVSLVESIVTPENEKIMVEKLKSMSSKAIQTMAKEIRKSENLRTFNFTVTNHTQKLFSTVKKLLNVSDLSDDKVFERMLEYIVVARNAEYAEVSEITTEATEIVVTSKVVQNSTNTTTATNFKVAQNSNATPKTNNRYIAAKTKMKIKQKYDNKCSYPDCNKKTEHLHHIERFSKCKNHNKLVPLCKIHHEFAHNNLIANEFDSPEYWKLNFAPTTNIIDLKYQKFRS